MTQPMTSESREARRREREKSFGLPIGQVAAVAVVLMIFVAALLLFPDHFLLVLGGLTAAGSVVVARQLRGDDADELPPASPAFRALADPTRPLPSDAPVSREGKADEGTGATRQLQARAGRRGSSTDGR